MTYYAEGDHLFAKFEVRASMDAHMKKMFSEIDGIDPEEILATDAEELADYYEEEYLAHVPTLDEDNITVDQGETGVDVSGDITRGILDRSKPFYLTGTAISFFIPFEGDSIFFRMQPTTFSTNPPRAELPEGELVLRYTTLEHDSEGVQQSLERDLKQIQTHLERLRNDVATHNKQLRGEALARVKQRQEKLRKDRGLAEGFGFPLREREGAPKTYIVPTKRKRLPAQRPTPKSSPAKPLEPDLHMEHYEKMLSIMDNMVTVMELSPHAFRTMGEEDLRSHFLVQLNGQYEGDATGETFNYEGKTDILVKVDGKNIFIAECLIWDGPSSLTNKLDQLLGYASWRDTKTAIVVFSRKKDFSAVVGKVSPTLHEHPKVLEEIAIDGETRSRFTVQHRDDPDRMLTLTVLVYNVPSE